MKLKEQTYHGYQGDVDWNVISNQDIDFAYIKATEGKSYVDEKFRNNYNNVINIDLPTGFYHFFSFESSGEEQAQNYINQVEEYDNMLPPVVDIEFYNMYGKTANISEVKDDLKVLLKKLEEHYGVSPIIYTTNSCYERYIKNDFQNYKIWIRDIFYEPKLKDNRSWTFWQYTDKEKLEGYNGEEKFIDLNVFNGTKEDLEKLMLKNQKDSIKQNEKVSYEYLKILEIKDNSILLELSHQETKQARLILNNEIHFNNARTNEDMDIGKIKIGDSLYIEKAEIIGDTLSLEESDNKIGVIRNISGDELKEELLNQESITADIIDIKINEKNNEVILSCDVYDSYYCNSNYEKFKIDVKVELGKTTIFANDENILEKIKKLAENKETIFVTPEKNSYKNETIVAKNIEVMGC